MMEAGDGPMSGYAAAICQAFNKAKKSGGIEKPSAALLFYCGGMGMAVGDNLTAGLTSEVSSEPLLPLLSLWDPRKSSFGCTAAQSRLSFLPAPLFC